jgi:uncharacterized protein YbjT (DUF2867 family)
VKIALIGASGLVGSRILTEALARGHEATAIVRNPDRLHRHPKLVARQGEIAKRAPGRVARDQASGRTSTVPPKGSVGMRCAIATASSKSLHSIRW